MHALFIQKVAKPAAYLLFAMGLMAGQAWAEPVFKRIPTQYIAALGDIRAMSGTNAQSWGLWLRDPGPRGVRLDSYDELKAAGGVTPANWNFDGADWWLEEHGLLMEQPQFPMVPGKYVVTGGREATAVLTVHPKAKDGTQAWELGEGARLYDVTHLRCRAARYTPASGPNSCSPEKAQVASIPVAPGEAMPAVSGCNKQDYQVLIVVGMMVDG